MNMYYAAGAGMGHLTRALAFGYSFFRDDEDFIFIVSSPHAAAILGKKNFITIPPEIMNNPSLLQAWLIRIIDTHAIRDIYLDTFPAGLWGEWNHFPASVNHRFYLTGRLIDWQKYVDTIVSPPDFERIYIFEPLEQEQQSCYGKLGAKISFEVLKYPPALVPEQFSAFIKTATRPVWLIVHSETEDELLLLYHHARDIALLEEIQPEFVIISPSVPVAIRDEVTSFDFFPAYQCFEDVQKIFTACGFNSMQQTRTYAHKHIFIPFERKFDNQFLRAGFRR